VFQALGDVLGLYSNIAIAWIMAVVADLVINKPLGLSPQGIEFKRAHLYDINPVGVGAMALASALSIAAYLGVFGAMAQAFSALVALVTAMVTSPLLAWITKGRYYIARESQAEPGGYSRLMPSRCVICERNYEGPDMAHCPAYQGPICSLCCTLDARCGDACKPHASLSVQWSGALRWLLPKSTWPYLDTGLSHFVLLMGVIVPLLITVFAMFYRQELAAFADMAYVTDHQAALRAALQSGFSKAFAALLLLSCIVAWWLVLAHKSRQVAQEESNRQTHLLMVEIELHRQTDKALQEAKQVAEMARKQADLANAAKSRYISAISHELRTPLNSILGYAQLMGQDAGIPPHRKQAVSVILRGGEHLLSLMEGTLEVAQIESGKLVLALKPLQFEAAMADMAAMFELQAEEKGLSFTYEVQGGLPPWVKADDKRLRQICFNLLGNAIKFTQRGGVTLRVRYAREMAHIEIVDTGPGMTAAEIERVYEPFVRGAAAGSGGSGLGLTIAKMLTDLMGGEMQVKSVPGQGSVFAVRLFLPQLHLPPEGAQRLEAERAQRRARSGYAGPRRKILVVDNEAADRSLLLQLLEPLGFALRQAASGHDCLDLLAAGLNPDVVLLDLAMPGIDGWETLRRIRALGAPQPAVAIVSANAFDRSLDNGLGIAVEDFIVKPVRHSELLDWLGRRLQLQWLDRPTEPAPLLPQPPATTQGRLPREALLALQTLVQLGYYRGIVNKLGELAAAQPQGSAFVATLGMLARQYQFEAMLSELQKALDEPVH
jgi:signal transduction histidine kinase/CheY-like chemotaxis protein